MGIFRLQGEAGSELGLYLFGGEATSVNSSSSLRSSSKPGGIQSFTFQLQPGTYYVNVNGRNVDREYNYLLTVSLLIDSSPPFLRVSPASGKMFTADSDVVIRVNATDQLSGVDALRWRVDGGAWSGWSEYSSALVTVSLPETEGLHRVEMQARNGAQLVSPTASLDVILDLTAPLATLVAPEETTVISVPRPTITYQFNESMDGEAWLRRGLLVYKFEGPAVQGTYKYDAATRRGTFRPNANLVPGGTYVVEFSGAADRAGNAPVGGAWSFTYLAKTSLSIVTRNVVAVGDESVRLQFRALKVPAGEPILLEELVALGGGVFRWSVVRETAARGDGTLQSIRFTPVQSGRYTLRFPGSDSHRTSRTSSINLTLTPAVSALGRTGVREATAGAEAAMTFRVLPASVDQVTLIKYRCNATFSSCTVVERLPASPDADGELRHFWNAESGNWAWRVRVAADAENRAAQSRLIAFRVR